MRLFCEQKESFSLFFAVPSLRRYITIPKEVLPSLRKNLVTEAPLTRGSDELSDKETFATA